MTTTATSEIINPLDMGFDTEIAYWETNEEELTRKYPGKYLVIRGNEVCAVLDNSKALLEAEEKELAEHPALVRFIFESEPVLSPFSQEVISA